MRILAALALLLPAALADGTAADLAKARAEALRTGKPLMITFRCVP